MLKKPPYGLFITGTDTEVGKTYVATLIAKAHGGSLTLMETGQPGACFDVRLPLDHRQAA